MITLSAEITIFSSENGSLSSIGWYNDISRQAPISANLMDVKDKYESVGGNPFALGFTQLGKGQIFHERTHITNYEKSAGFVVGEAFSDENGKFQDEYVIQISVLNLKSLTIVFDTYNHRHPKKIRILGTTTGWSATYTDDDPIFSISDTTSLNIWNDEGRENNYLIYIDDWSAPNAPLIIQGIYITPQTLQIDHRNIISIDRSIFDRSDISLPSWGIISNGGNIEFNDSNDEIKDYAEQGLLKDSQTVRIYITDTISGLKEQVGDFETSSWYYDVDNRSASVSLIDGLGKLQNIDYAGMALLDSETSLYRILGDIFIAMSSNFYFYGYISDYLDAQTYDILIRTKVKYRWLESGSFWAQLQKICEVIGLYIYCHPSDRKRLVISHEFRG